MKRSNSSKKKFAVVIPALNEEAQIQFVVKAVHPFAKPIVVDDGSSDKTASLAREAGAFVLRHNYNKGYDAALETGLFCAIREGYDYSITIDADGQHQPEILEKFKEKLVSGADLVVGKRDKFQRLSERIFSLVSRNLWGIHDPLCGVKGYRLEYVQKIGHFDSYCSIGTECTVRAAKGGWRVEQVPIKTQPRLGDSRFGSGIRANWRIMRALFFGLFYVRKDKL